jgi:cell pole-organizing protein PopZ
VSIEVDDRLFETGNAMSKDGDNSEPSIDDIVASIRRIISDEETKTRKPPPLAAKPDDILELTNMLNDDGTVSPLPQPAPKQDTPQPNPPFGDLEDEAPIYAAKPPSDGPRIINRPPPRPLPDDSTATMGQPAAQPPSDKPPAPQPTPSPTRVTTSMSTNNPTTGSGVTLTPVGSPQPTNPPAAAPGPALASPQTVGAAASAFDRLTQAALQQNAPPAAPSARQAPSAAGRSVEDLVREMLRPILQQWIDTNLPGMVERLVQQEIQRLTRR